MMVFREILSFVMVSLSFVSIFIVLSGILPDEANFYICMLFAGYWAYASIVEVIKPRKVKKYGKLIAKLIPNIIVMAITSMDGYEAEEIARAIRTLVKDNYGKETIE
jgi:hypothetical protein